MFTALDAAPERLDKHEQNFVGQIRKHGWFGTHVASDDAGPGFSYTTGFWLKFRLPELILFSMSMENAQDTFWHIWRQFEAGRRFPVGEPTEEIFENALAVLLPVAVEHYRSHLGWSRWFYGNDNFECHQIIFPDRGGAFPWAPGSSDEFRSAQPDLTAGNWSGLRGR
ncbi:DUF4262 domain-containing protein [Bradyrhizobium elkanii]|uniref:DUF4262 domain-containing protein n=1 Tax=Bradyrhizobium elkanii TaxID=29448 RepID=A0ABV4F3N9_BRAEL|nr:DUF4262 domain-containing protein [Bradyrhizobium elkanii]MBP2434972.1 hypothetical protein [Bradyrhizobium elkanii]MCP1749490.1 hypothetical protein [Bradyrhizobium elkanii]MCP1984062.1 hypothetical protein [Bradyrhizobium elkanii]MCS3890216.1 hypothetical protein [Bradyrhizobium elkanii]MCS4220186.1 hypothetical protein [Bradyrhizobium elkanii]